MDIPASIFWDPSPVRYNAGRHFKAANWITLSNVTEQGRSCGTATNEASSRRLKNII